MTFWLQVDETHADSDTFIDIKHAGLDLDGLERFKGSKGSGRTKVGVIAFSVDQASSAVLF